jgi:hypothetical protein
LFNGLKTRRPEPLDERDKTNFSISAVPARERFSKMLSRVLSLHWRCIQLQHILRIVPATAQRSAVQAHPKWSGQSVINNYSDRRHKSLEGSRTLSKLLRLSDARKKFRARARPVPTRLVKDLCSSNISSGTPAARSLPKNKKGPESCEFRASWVRDF